MRSLQTVLGELGKNLIEVLDHYRDGLTCPRDALNNIVHLVCEANAECADVSCSQDWKPCLLEPNVICSGKTHHKPDDIVGRCDVCKTDVKANESYTKVNTLGGARHNSCI